MARKKTPPEVDNRTAWEQFVDRASLVEIPNCPEPTRTFAFEQPVRLGGLYKPRTVESYLDGRYYLVRHEAKETRDGPPAGTVLEGVFPWHVIFPKDSGSAKTDFSKDAIDLHYTTNSIDGLIHSALRGIDMNPDYQRDLVWAPENRERLITSIMRGAQIGAFVIRRLPWEEGRTKFDEIVDGKQRLTTILDFYLDRFHYKGYKYSELSWKDQRQFGGHMVSVAEIREGTPVEEVLRVFLALNETGVPVDPAHLEKIRTRLQSGKT